MATEVQASPAAPMPTGAKALLAHLRDHPDARFERPKALAERFGVAEEFVVRVLERAEPQVRRAGIANPNIATWIYELKKRVKLARDEAAKHPTTFVLNTTVFAEFVLLLVSVTSKHKAIDLNNQVNIFGQYAWIPLLAVLLQMGLFFRKGMVRYALYGAVAFWLVGGIPLLMLAWTTSPVADRSDRFGQAIFIFLIHFCVSLTYAVVGSVLSFLGEYRRVLRENRRVEQMSRQELLERLFQLEARMEMARNEPDRKVRFSKVTTFFKARLLVVSFFMGFLIRMAANGTIGTQLATSLSVHNGTLPPAIPLALAASINLLNYAAIVLLAYLAPNLGTALILGLVYSCGEMLGQVLFLPAQHGLPQPVYFAYLVSIAWIPLRTMGLSTLAGIWAAIQTKTLNDLNLQRNDEASLVAEQLKIQWRLAEHTCSTTVMVVDVVRSTQMKEGEPPLEVEYSFRKFQQWIEDISVNHSGSVTSTAGDGAVMSFESAHNAFLAATEIQRRMPAFNQSWNRLTTRFRVRIGLHMGQVQGDLGKVQFAQVIDIAAHLQKIAPAGGVAVTDEVMATLGVDAFVPLAVKSDGHNVYLALNPSGL